MRGSRARRQRKSVSGRSSSSSLQSLNTEWQNANNSSLTREQIAPLRLQMAWERLKSILQSMEALLNRLTVILWAIWLFCLNVWRPSSRHSLHPFFLPLNEIDDKNRRRRILLVLDIDETLVHSSTQSQLVVRQSRRHAIGVSMSNPSGGGGGGGGGGGTIRFRPDFQLEVAEAIEQHTCLYYVYKRPYVDQFLATVSRWFDLAVYTASVQSYADPLIDKLASQAGIRIPASRRFYRRHCARNPDAISRRSINGGENGGNNINTITTNNNTITTNNNNNNNDGGGGVGRGGAAAIQSVQQEQLFIKDLPTVARLCFANSEDNRENYVESSAYDNDDQDDDGEDDVFVMKHVLMIDNSQLNLQSSPANGLLIGDWTAKNPDDCSLLRLLPVLDSLRHVKDIRSVVDLIKLGLTMLECQEYYEKPNYSPENSKITLTRTSKQMFPQFMVGVMAGALYEYTLIKLNFYDHLRLGSSRKVVEERDRIDVAVERLAAEYPDKFHDLPQRWQRIKDYEDSQPLKSH